MINANYLFSANILLKIHNNSHIHQLCVFNVVCYTSKEANFPEISLTP